MLFLLVHDISLDSFKCKICGKELKIKNWTLKNTYCYTKCAMNDEDLQKRKAETIAKDPNYWKNRQEKIIKTNLERYGTKTPAENKKIANTIINNIGSGNNINIYVNNYNIYPIC